MFQRGVANYTLGEQGTAEIIITINSDDIYEADEEVLLVRIVSVSGGVVDPERQEAIITIVDDDCESGRS